MKKRVNLEIYDNKYMYPLFIALLYSIPEIQKMLINTDIYLYNKCIDKENIKDNKNIKEYLLMKI